MVRSHQLERARGALYGQLIGDSLGSLVEFQSAESIHTQYPQGVRALADGGTYGLSAGQPTDDSEMALSLAESLVRHNGFVVEDVAATYRRWAHSDPFDIGLTCSSALNRGEKNPKSQANGALMRVSPLGIFGARLLEEPDGAEQLAQWAREECAITHINPLCTDIQAVYVLSIARIISTGADRAEALEIVQAEAASHPEVAALVREHIDTPPAEYLMHQGWVTIAFGNAVYELASPLRAEESLVRTVGRGGDTDTNAAITGALVGAVDGMHAWPSRWVDVIDCFHQDDSSPRPRPREYWPNHAYALAGSLVGA
ncbi:ADP-ribosyl-[dinitrogen reductase] glycohydrolase [Corynebacterium ciconiae DSM 44920]|uniref:ADP-ribosylglycohydrolase family protein n=1 Tax=Corynebacterium ciconiae TaxID=227319 RepID=UPI000375B00B|nr:ADP-ribosylglycohydrolase family protein [Corynebacterium ciconiae]WKD60644.1 ADP-ribosyl-[dinitrogen reductase] glycohydrolase [Corynebacterium ciconiae DSM 44920]